MRLSPTLPQLTLACASSSVLIYLQLLLGQEELAVMRSQMVCSGTSEAAHARGVSRVVSATEFLPKLHGLLHESDKILL